MSLDVFEDLYDRLNARKAKPEDSQPYAGGNGRIDRCVQLVRQGKLPRQGTLVDVGGATGNLCYALRDDFKNARVVYDITRNSVELAVRRGAATMGVPGNIDVDGLRSCSDGSVDLVAALDFIEHIVDPEKFARECHRVLRKNGAVFINTPNIRFWGHLEQLVIRGSFPHTSGDREVYHGGHLAFFTRRDLEEIFGAAGLVDLEQVRDAEGFRQPPEMWLRMLPVTNQRDLMRNVEELGNPNLLFIARKR